jgi:hypothetical protein
LGAALALFRRDLAHVLRSFAADPVVPLYAFAPVVAAYVLAARASPATQELLLTPATLPWVLAGTLALPALTVVETLWDRYSRTRWAYLRLVVGDSGVLCGSRTAVSATLLSAWVVSLSLLLSGVTSFEASVVLHLASGMSMAWAVASAATLAGASALRLGVEGGLAGRFLRYGSIAAVLLAWPMAGAGPGRALPVIVAAAALSLAMNGLAGTVLSTTEFVPEVQHVDA